MNFKEISQCFFSGKFVKGLTKASVRNAMQRRKSLKNGTLIQHSMPQGGVRRISDREHSHGHSTNREEV